MSLGRYDVVSCMESIFLQMLMWERFEVLAPTLLNILPQCSAGLRRKKSEDESLATVIDVKDNLNFQPYVYVPTGIHKVQLLEDAGLEVTLVSRSLFR